MKDSCAAVADRTRDGRAVRRAEYRRRILDAAKHLIVKHGDTSFSSKDLADAAGVSLATPYNHFGSKAGVLLELLRRDLSSLSAPDMDPGGRNAVEIASWSSQLASASAERYVENSIFYRPLYRAALTELPHEAGDLVAQGAEIWGPLVSMMDKAIDGGLCVSQNQLKQSLEAAWVGHQYQWAVGAIGGLAFCNAVAGSTALIMHGAIMMAKGVTARSAN